MGEGYVKIYRNLLENVVFQDAKLLKVWVWCLLRAGHKPTRLLFANRVSELAAGEFITGREVAAEETHLTPSTLWRKLRLLEQLGKVDIKTNNKFSVITVTNWSVYQALDGKADSKMDNKWTTNGQQMDTNKNDKNDKKVLLSLQKEVLIHPEAENLCACLRDSIHRWNPGYKIKTWATWLKDMSLLLRVDQRDPEKTKAIIKAAHKDTPDLPHPGTWKGWAAVVLSPASLREKWEKLKIFEEAPKRKGRREPDDFTGVKEGLWDGGNYSENEGDPEGETADLPGMGTGLPM